MKRGWFLAALGSAAVAPALPLPTAARSIAIVATRADVVIRPAFIEQMELLWAQCNAQGPIARLTVVSKLEHALICRRWDGVVTAEVVPNGAPISQEDGGPFIGIGLVTTTWDKLG